MNQRILAGLTNLESQSVRYTNVGHIFNHLNDFKNANIEISVSEMKQAILSLHPYSMLESNNILFSSITLPVHPTGFPCICSLASLPYLSLAKYHLYLEQQQMIILTLIYLLFFSTQIHNGAPESPRVRLPVHLFARLEGKWLFLFLYSMKKNI